jgi:hypothetical protein
MNPIYVAAAAILGQVKFQLQGTAAGWPDNARECVVPGELAWDDCTCGLLAVEMVTTDYSENFLTPTHALADKCRPYITTELRITALRCAPGPGSQGEAPSCTALDSAAQTQFDDTLAVMQGIAQALMTLDANQVVEYYAAQGVKPAGPQGACVGVTSTALIAISNTYGPC